MMLVVRLIQPGRLGALVLIKAVVVAGQFATARSIVIRPTREKRRQEAATEWEAPPQAAFPSLLPLFHLWSSRLPLLPRIRGLCRLGIPAASSPTPQDICPKERSHVVAKSRMNEWIGGLDRWILYTRVSSRLPLVFLFVFLPHHGVQLLPVVQGVNIHTSP